MNMPPCRLFTSKVDALLLVDSQGDVVCTCYPTFRQVDDEQELDYIIDFSDLDDELSEDHYLYIEAMLETILEMGSDED